MNTLIAGKNPSGTNTPVSVDADGKLLLAAAFTGTVSVGSVQIDQATAHANEVVVKSGALPAGAATETTSAAILAKLVAAPATAANQTTGNGSLSSIDGKVATETTLGAILAKLIASPATESSLAALNAKVTAVNTGAVVVASGTVTANVQTVSLASSTAYEASRIVKDGAGTLFSLSGYNSGPAQFLQVHNSATLPANGAAPAMLLAIPAQSTFAFEWDKGVVLSAGIVVSNSSTGATKTIGSADCYFTATYI